MTKIHTDQSDLLGGPGLPLPPFEITKATTKVRIFSGNSHAFPSCFTLPLTPLAAGPNEIPGCMSTQSMGSVTFSPQYNFLPHPQKGYQQKFYSWTIIYLGPGADHNDGWIKKYPSHLSQPSNMITVRPQKHPKGFSDCPPWTTPHIQALWENIDINNGYLPWNYCMYNTTYPYLTPHHVNKIFKWNTPNPNSNYRGYLNKNNKTLNWYNNKLLLPLLANKLTDNGWVAPIIIYQGYGTKVHSQPHLWKAIAALRSVILYRPFSNATFLVKACIQSPYAFLLAYYYTDVAVNYIGTVYNVQCFNCTTTNCITRDNGNYKVMLLVRQPPYIMIPVNVTGSWYNDQSIRALQLLNNKLIRSKRFIAALILGTTALISIITSMTVSAIALTKQIHTATFADQLSKNVTLALSTQEIIDRILNDRVDALEEAVLAIGQELITQNKIGLMLSLRF